MPQKHNYTAQTNAAELKSDDLNVLIIAIEHEWHIKLGIAGLDFTRIARWYRSVGVDLSREPYLVEKRISRNKSGEPRKRRRDRGSNRGRWTSTGERKLTSL